MTPASTPAPTLELTPRHERLILAARRLRLARQAGDWGAHATAAVALIAAGGDPAHHVDYLLGDFRTALP